LAFSAGFGFCPNTKRGTSGRATQIFALSITIYTAAAGGAGGGLWSSNRAQ
jgi:hypothetical protein